MVLSAAFIVVVSISKYFDIFKAIHAVERPTMGEIYFALAVGLLAFITHQPWVYAVALLHMSLADGLAAVMGVTYGKSSRYQVFGHTKSVIGSLTFLVVSIGLLGLFSWVAVPLSIGMVIMLAAGSTLLENLGGNGLDNLLVPLVVGAVLHSAV
jgi:phytol kinase